ncbi:hypothetical protein GJ496_006746 [Pomphorhynchus laevis]|nr:hypothetical protein GJ496_006746 [Pomphorhynchus laevis]
MLDTPKRYLAADDLPKDGGDFSNFQISRLLSFAKLAKSKISEEHCSKTVLSPSIDEMNIKSIRRHASNECCYSVYYQQPLHKRPSDELPAFTAKEITALKLDCGYSFHKSRDLDRLSTQFDICSVRLECSPRKLNGYQISIPIQQHITANKPGFPGPVGSVGKIGPNGYDGKNFCNGVKSAFYVYDGMIPSVRSTNELHQIYFQIVSLNYGADFDKNRSIYSAPVSGIYSFHVFLNGFLNASQVFIAKRNSTTLSGWIENTIITGWYGSLKIRLARKDEVRVLVKYRNDSQTFNTIMFGPFASFGGYLINEVFDT